MLLKIFFWYLVYFSGLNFIYNLFSGPKLILIGYHSISNTQEEGKNYGNLSVNKGNFKKQIDYLKRGGYKIITFKDIINGAKEGVVVFFDDGFKDIFFNALPILKKNNIEATVFLTTDLIDQADILWTIKLRYFMGSLQETEDLISQLKDMLPDERKKKLESIFSKYSGELPKIFMGWEQVRQSADIFEYGSHGRSHKDFIEMDENELLKELTDSKIKIEKETQKSVEAISYPHGKYSENVIKLVKEMGYLAGVSTEYGFSQGLSLFKLKKILPEPNDNLIIFKLKLGIYYPLKNLLKKIL